MAFRLLRINLKLRSQRKQSTVDAVTYDKIRVNVSGHNLQDSAKMVLNRGMSSPMDAALHISPSLHRTAALALVTPEAGARSSKSRFYDDETTKADREPVDMNQALLSNCQLEILSFKMSVAVDDQCYHLLHQAYWRTCSILLMHVLNSAFAEQINVHSMSILPYQPGDGSFGVKFSLGGSGVANWVPGELDLRRFTRTARKIVVEKELQMIGLSAYQVSGLEYQVDGPCITSFDLIGPFAVTACQRVNDSEFIVQGVSLPAELKTNHFLFGRLEEHARKVPRHILNMFPGSDDVITDDACPPLEKLILNNRGKKYSHVYKQFHNKYDLDDIGEIDFEDNGVEMEQIKDAKREKMTSQPDHPKIQQHRQHELAFGWRQQRHRGTGGAEGGLRVAKPANLWRQPKFQNTVGRTRYQFQSESE